MSINYTVRPGDTLSSIARKHGFSTWKDVYYHPENAAFRAKRPNPNLIYPGDVVVIPKKGSAPATTSPAAPAAKPRTCELPALSTFATWPSDLIQTLCRSYQSHAAGNRYLDNAFWGGEPSSFEDALNRLGGLPQHAVKSVHGRATAITGLWPFVQFIHNIWSTDSHGFAFTCTDKTKLRAFLDSSPSFCRDIPIMMSDHQALGPAQCWREVVNQTAGLHICLPKDDTLDQRTVAGESNIHIDPHQFVKGKDADGTCSYSAAGMIDHGRDVGAGVIRRWSEQRLKELDEAMKRSGEFWENEPRGPKW